MELLGIKRFSYGTALAFVVLLVLLVAGAMFFGEEAKDLFGRSEPKTTQVMELRGSWLGMKLTSLDSPTVQRMGIPPSLPGVMIVEIAERDGWRARQAGAVEGDVIVAVDGKNVRDLADLYDVSRSVDVGNAVLLDVRRWGQPMTLVLPALHVLPTGVAGGQPGQAGPLPPATAFPMTTPPTMAMGANAAGTQPVAWNPAAQGPQFYCPTHGRMWPQNAVHPHYRCPLGNCPLSRVR